MGIMKLLLGSTMATFNYPVSIESGNINMISYLAILTGQVKQTFWAVNMITITYQI